MTTTPRVGVVLYFYFILNCSLEGWIPMSVYWRSVWWHANNIRKIKTKVSLRKAPSTSEQNFKKTFSKAANPTVETRKISTAPHQKSPLDPDFPSSFPGRGNLLRRVQQVEDGTAGEAARVPATTFGDPSIQRWPWRRRDVHPFSQHDTMKGLDAAGRGLPEKGPNYLYSTSPCHRSTHTCPLALASSRSSRQTVISH